MNRRLRAVVRSLRKRELIWRYGFNFSPSIKYSFQPTTKLSPIEKSVLNDLNRYGVAITSVDNLFSGTSGFDSLSAAVERLLSSRKDEIADLATKSSDTGRIGSKTFNLELLGSELTFDSNDIFSRFALDPAFLNIANAYLRMYARLRYYNIWYTFATNSVARESQLWHFDREDQYILKIFIYLNDVGIGAGPFTYAPGTHRKGPNWDKRPAAFAENGVLRSTDDQMNAVVARENWIQATGKKGTIVFADTRGYHKGGEARDDDRLMYTCMFTSPASDSKQLLKCSPSNSYHQLDKKQLFALSIR